MCGICCNPAGERSCCCFSLSVGLLVIAAYFGVIGGVDIWFAVNATPRQETQLIGGIINACVAGYVCLCVLLGLLRLGIIAYICTMVAFLVMFANAAFKLVAFILCWIDWGKALNEGRMKFQTIMVTSTISQLVTIGVVLGFANLFWSAACVYRAGGNGCEHKSYKQIQTGQPKREKSEKEDESKV